MGLINFTNCNSPYFKVHYCWPRKAWTPDVMSSIKPVFQKGKDRICHQMFHQKFVFTHSFIAQLTKEVLTRQ